MPACRCHSASRWKCSANRRASPRNALGVKLGVLEAGAAADLVLTNYRPATPLTAENLAGHFLFAMGPEFVRDVMIGGWWVMRKGHVVTCDEAAIRARSVEVARATVRTHGRDVDAT